MKANKIKGRVQLVAASGTRTRQCVYTDDPTILSIYENPTQNAPNVCSAAKLYTFGQFAPVMGGALIG